MNYSNGVLANESSSKQLIKGVNQYENFVT